MTAKGIVNALNKEGFQGLVRLVNLIGIPVITTIGTIFINQANTIIKNQDRWFSIMEEHSRKLYRDSTQIGIIVKADRLITAKQDATINALEINSEIGLEWTSDYDKRRKELEEESKFLNP